MMTPGLREFILEAPADDPASGPKRGTTHPAKHRPPSDGGNDTPSPAPDRLPAALAALAQVFTVTTEPGAPGSGLRRRLWLDTFDRRLYRTGLVLEFEQAGRGGRLLLTRADPDPSTTSTPFARSTPFAPSAPLAEQTLTGWPPRRPAKDLPPGQVRDQIAALISPRALLPVVRGVSTVSVMRLQNADGKTVARLFVDRTAATTAATATAAATTATTATAATTTVELPPRLAVTEVRGYSAQARKAAGLLAAVPGITFTRQGAFTAALTALGRHPADYTNDVDAQITAQLPASVAVARLLLRLLDTLELNVDGVLRDIDTEFLHDLRVAVRRTRAALKLLGEVLPAGLAKQYAGEFKWLGDLTTPTRDLDVHLLGFGAMTEQLLAATPADLEPFRAFLVRRRARAFRRLAAGLRSARFQALTGDWRKTLLEVREARTARKRRPRRDPTAAALALSTTGRVYRRIAAQGGAIAPDSPPESLHDLRKRCKELRYLLEFFAPLHDPAAYKKVVGDLKQLQDCLGEFQDSQVQREEIGALADAMLTERAAPAATLLAMGELAARLAVSQAQARADFARRFARFAGPAAQPRIRTLLGEPAEPVPAKPAPAGSGPAPRAKAAR
ncbi:MAG: CHAD domain-containing protein [Streptosporangiaceae bacterium]|jgi:CHAD domain-containing protein